MTKSPRNAANRYLWFRDDTAVIWFRMAVPKRLRDAVGKPLIAESLGTTDVREARIRAGKRRAELLEVWRAVAPDLASARHRPTEAELEESAVVLAYELPNEAANDGRRNLRGKPGLYRAHVNYVQAELDEQARAAATGDFGPVRELAVEAIEALGFDLEPQSEGFAKLCELLNISRLVGLRV
jgi:hypothetical protein